MKFQSVLLHNFAGWSILSDEQSLNSSLNKSGRLRIWCAGTCVHSHTNKCGGSVFTAQWHVCTVLPVPRMCSVQAASVECVYRTERQFWGVRCDWACLSVFQSIITVSIIIFTIYSIISLFYSCYYKNKNWRTFLFFYSLTHFSQHFRNMNDFIFAHFIFIYSIYSYTHTFIHFGCWLTFVAQFNSVVVVVVVVVLLLFIAVLAVVSYALFFVLNNRVLFLLLFPFYYCSFHFFSLLFVYFISTLFTVLNWFFFCSFFHSSFPFYLVNFI